MESVAKSFVSLKSVNFSEFKVSEHLLPNKTFELFQRDNITLNFGSELTEVGEMLNSSDKHILDCGTMPDIVWVKVCSSLLLILFQIFLFSDLLISFAKIRTAACRFP